jgi:hypothetical protein
MLVDRSLGLAAELGQHALDLALGDHGAVAGAGGIRFDLFEPGRGDDPAAGELTLALLVRQPAPAGR